MRKKRILFLTEATYLNTGYATYSKQIIQKLIDTGRFEVAEFSIYGNPADSRRKSIKWKNYANMPDPQNEEHVKTYTSHPINQFGMWRFERVCLDFEPDCVFALRDFWMDSFIYNSPYRRIFSFAWMPTVDGMPQNEEWIDVFNDVDHVPTYSLWAKGILDSQSGGKINTVGPASPSAPIEFVPMDQEACRRELGLPVDAKIIGMVARNQRRKLFPVLIKAFSRYLKETGDKKTYLYLHTSFPDSGWNLGQLIHDNEVSSRVLMSYVCEKCGHFECCHFNDARKQCLGCGAFTSVPACVGTGLDNLALAKLYNCFDLYLQIANCLTPGQDIVTESGLKKIEDIAIGDSVLTHKNRFRKVLSLSKTKIKTDILTIRCHSDCDSLEITDEHPVLCLSAVDNNYSSKCVSFREEIGRRIKDGKFNPIHEFIDAGDLCVGDFLISPINLDGSDYTIDLTDYIDEKYSISNGEYKYQNKKSHPVKIDVSDNFAKLIGLFVADGSSTITKSAGNIAICSNKKDVENIQLAVDEFSKLGNYHRYEYKNRHAIDIKLSNKVLAHYFSDNFGKNENKRLPNWAMTLPVEKQKKVLQGMFMGDGHYVKNLNISKYCTISEPLFRQIKTLCLRTGLVFNVRKATRGGNRKPQYLFEIKGDIRNGIFETVRSNTRSFVHNGFYYRQIKSISENPYDGYVYNFEVEEDNSYVTNVSAVHNCEGFGVPAVEALSCGIPVACTNYSAMTDFVNRANAIPIEFTTYKELETGCERAVPSEDSIISAMKSILGLSGEEFSKVKRQTRELFEKNFSIQAAADVWTKIADECEYANWKQDPILRQVVDIPVGQKTNTEFVNDLCNTYLTYEPHKKSYMSKSILRDLNRGSTRSIIDSYYVSEFSPFAPQQNRPINREMLVKEFKGRLHKSNVWEQARVDRSILIDGDEEWL